MAFQFFFGELGVVDAWEKQRTIANIKLDIASIKVAANHRLRQIELLSKDKGTIRAMALLYGMTGGDNVKATSLPTPTNSARSAPEPAAELRPFLLRHPVLIVLLGLIFALLIGFFFSRRLRHIKDDAVEPMRSRYIKPSWTP